MSNGTRHGQPPLRVRLFYGRQAEPDYASLDDTDLAALQHDRVRLVEAPWARLLTGMTDRRAAVSWEHVATQGREVRVRLLRPIHSPDPDRRLPLVVHVHGGGFVGTATQCDWLTSRLAAALPAVVVSVEHRLVNHATPLTAAVDDGWDVLLRLVEDADTWQIDPDRVALVGESAGGAVAAMTAIRAVAAGLPLRAQVLVNPVTDLSTTAAQYPSMTEHARTPTLSAAQLEFFRGLAAPTEELARAVSPLHTEDLAGLPPALFVIPLLDPLADQAVAYAHRLRDHGVPAQVASFPRSGHAFVSMPGLTRAARPARREILDFLSNHLR